MHLTLKCHHASLTHNDRVHARQCMQPLWGISTLKCHHAHTMIVCMRSRQCRGGAPSVRCGEGPCNACSHCGDEMPPQHVRQYRGGVPTECASGRIPLRWHLVDSWPRRRGMMQTASAQTEDAWCVCAACNSRAFSEDYAYFPPEKGEFTSSEKNCGVYTKGWGGPPTVSDNIWACPLTH